MKFAMQIGYEHTNKLCMQYFSKPAITKYYDGVIIWGYVKKGKAVPLQAWSSPEGSRKLRFPDYMTTAQDGGKVDSLTHRPPLHSGNAPGTHFCKRLSRRQGHSAIRRIMSMKNSNLESNQRPSDL
jgi:hypothetical protein